MILTSPAQTIAATLGRHSFRFTDEYDLQTAIDTLLREQGYNVTAEYRLTPYDRIDFMVAPNVGIEVKIAGGRGAVARQLRRYAAHPEIHELVLVTARLHLSGIDDVGCPLYVVSLPGVA